MKYIYLDESINENYVGYGALFVTDGNLAKQVVDKALIDLINDPDRNDKQCKELDDRTISRQFFHACDDSKNAHSHICTAINTSLKGEFYSQVFDINKMSKEESSIEYLFDLTSGLSSLRMFETREPVTIVFEERNGLTKQKIEEWLNRYSNSVVASVYDHPYIPTLFPEVKIEISSKENSGLQCCDFLLWAVMRKLQGKSTWYDRFGSCFKSESTPPNNEWFGFYLDFGKVKGETNINYKLEDYPIDPDSKISQTDLINFYLYAERILLHLSQNGVPTYLKYMEASIIKLADEVLDEDINRVKKVADLYIRLFDTLPVISAECSAKDKEFLLFSKKQSIGARHLTY